MRWFNSLLSRSRKRNRRPAVGPRAGSPLWLEQLESRTLLSATENVQFVAQAFRDLFHREIGTGSLVAISNVLNQGISRNQIVMALESSPEFRVNEVQTAFNGLLHRSADVVSAGALANFLGAGVTVEQLQAALAGSQEYYVGRGGGTNDGFLTAFYQDALQRAIDPASRTALDQLLAAGVSRMQLAQAIYGSTEYRMGLARNLFQQYLNHGLAPAAQTAVAQVLGTLRDEQLVAILLASAEYAPGGVTVSSDPVPSGDTAFLTPGEVGQLLQRAAAATASNDAIIAIVDRGGRVLGVRMEGGISPAITANVATVTFAVDGALAEARTGAFFASDQAPLTSRTVNNLSQSTITQREVESNPSIIDPNSVFRGPGFVAAVGTGGHFPIGIAFTPQVDLFEIEHTNRDSIMNPGPDRIKGTADDVLLPSRFNDNPAFIPAGAQLTPPESYGFVSGIMPGAQLRGIGTLPGGMPTYKNGELVGGIGVFFPGTTGFASAENSSMDVRYNPGLPDRSLEAEYIAFAAVGGSAGAGAAIGPLGGVAPLPGGGLPFGRIDLNGITLDIFGPNGNAGPGILVNYGRALGVGNPNSGYNLPVGTGGDTPPGPGVQPTLLDGRPVPEGWLVLPHAGTVLSAADVGRLINQGIATANQTRAQIRLPIGVRTSMVVAVADVATGEVLGLYRMPDATVFSIDVAVAKARNVAYYANPAQLQPIDQRDPLGPGGQLGLPAGAGLTNRTFRYLSEPRYPEGIDGLPPGPFSQLLDGGASFQNGVQIGALLPASAYQSVLGHDAFNPATNFHDPFNILNQNGVVFFPGSVPVYTAGLAGGLGVSGDGVNEDDVVTFGASQGYLTPAPLRADMYFVRGVRLPYQKFDFNPLA